MSTRELILRERVGMNSHFTDPQDINVRFNHALDLKKRQVGKNRQTVIQNTFVLTSPYLVKDCADSCGVEVFDTARVYLSGNDAAHVASIWEDLKRNVDLAITKSVLNGIPLPLTPLAFSITVPEVEPTP